MEDEELVRNLSNSAIFCDLERPVTRITRARDIECLRNGTN